MYASTNATREHSLKAAAAAWRAIERHVCCKSQFKFKCFSCGEMVNRGDKITRCVRKTTGMNLRYRGADCCNGLAMAETVFYQGETGENMWVHIGCQPCYWYKGFDNGDESSPPGLREMPTEWGAKLMMEWADWTSGPGGESWLIMGLPHFLKVKGYPKEKSMKKRIINAVIRFQAIWRGYLYKKAYPEALLQSQAEQMFPHEMEAAADEEIDAALLYRQQTCWEEEDEFGNTFIVKTNAGKVAIQQFSSTVEKKMRQFIVVKLLKLRERPMVFMFMSDFTMTKNGKSITGKSSRSWRGNAAIS